MVFPPLTYLVSVERFPHYKKQKIVFRPDLGNLSYISPSVTINHVQVECLDSLEGESFVHKIYVSILLYPKSSVSAYNNTGVSGFFSRNKYDVQISSFERVSAFSVRLITETFICLLFMKLLCKGIGQGGADVDGIRSRQFRYIWG